jgi:RNA polymerase sigma-70 factor (ECF subfamily)
MDATTMKDDNIKNTTSRISIHHAGLSPRALPAYKDMSEPQLIASCQHRDQAAFRQLLQTYEHFVMSVLYRLAPDLPDRADLAQEVYVRMWSSIDQLRNPHSFRRWVTQITRNVFYDELRRRRSLPTVSFDSANLQDNGEEALPLQIADTSPSPEELTELKELSHMMKQALVQMPSQFQMMILLRDVEGLSYNEISEITGSELGTTKSRIARARARMQMILTPYTTCAEIEKVKVPVRPTRAIRMRALAASA